MNFSIVLPTLGNKDLVLKMLDSFERTTRYKDKIEFLIAIDKGKTKIKKIAEDQNYSFKVTFFERPKTDDFTNDYYNWLANKSIGKNIMVFNDDAWMRTNDWDVKILRVIDESCSSIYCLDIPDTARMKYKHQFPCFPCVSRRAFCTLGFVLHPKIRMYPADQVTFSMYEKAGRVIPIRNVIIEHEHIVETDNSKSRMMVIYKEDREKNKDLNLSDEVYKIMLAGQSDCRRLSKLKGLLILLRRENHEGNCSEIK